MLDDRVAVWWWEFLTDCLAVLGTFGLVVYTYPYLGLVSGSRLRQVLDLLTPPLGFHTTWLVLCELALPRESGAES